MGGVMDGLSPEQQRKARDYDGPEDVGRSEYRVQEPAQGGLLVSNRSRPLLSVFNGHNGGLVHIKSGEWSDSVVLNTKQAKAFRRMLSAAIRRAEKGGAA